LRRLSPARGEAGVAFCVAAPLLYICWRWWNQSVTVYERGFVWKRGRRLQVVRWAEVADLEAETIEDSFVPTFPGHTRPLRDGVGSAEGGYR
jgi:hypothetical protein